MPTPADLALTLARGHPRRVRALARHLPPIGLEAALASADRTGARVEVPGEAAARGGFAWDAADGADETWWPQGVASLHGGRVLLVSWYAKGTHPRRGPGSRITLVDRSDPDRPRYRHVLLVDAARSPRVTMRAVPVHAGGIAVVAGLLYVADTAVGVRVFSLDDVLALDDAVGGAGAARGRRPALGRRRGGWVAHGHSAVLPERHQLRVPLVRGRGRLRFSFLSTGRVGGELSLVAGEYRRAGQGSAWLVRWRLDEATGLPIPDAAGRALPAEVHAGAPPRMQGVAVDGDTWWISASSGRGKAGDLHVGAPGALHRHRGVLPPGPEDLCWAVPGEQLWCATEWPGARCVFPIDAQRWRPADRWTTGAAPPARSG